MDEIANISAAAFFPWVSLKAPIEIGSSLRLLPYRRGKLPGELPFASQADVDWIFSAYSNTRNSGVTDATILEVDEWRTGMGDANIRDRLFRARNIIGFSALAKRRLFASHFGYCSFDVYTLVVQRYRPGAGGGFSFTTRRRDGGAMYYWGADDFAFQRPNHVAPRAEFSVDADLARCLAELPPDIGDRVLEAIGEFNSANTDSSDIPEHIELVTMKSAFEWLFGISESSIEFVRALDQSLSGIVREQAEEGPLRSAWNDRFPNAKGSLEKWAREFCDLRGASAHGVNRRAQRFVWRARCHMAFVSMLFPILVKKRLADAGHWRFDAFDAARLAQIESYLMYDPFAYDPVSHDGNPWADLDSRAYGLAMASRWAARN